jgi:hypothetical protein
MKDAEWLGRVAKSMGQASLSSAVGMPYTLAVIGVLQFAGVAAVSQSVLALGVSSLITLLTVANACVAWHRCFKQDPRLLRSESYNIRMTELELLGDSESGVSKTTATTTQIELRPIQSPMIENKHEERRCSASFSSSATKLQPLSETPSQTG